MYEMKGPRLARWVRQRLVT